MPSHQKPKSTFTLFLYFVCHQDMRWSDIFKRSCQGLEPPAFQRFSRHVMLSVAIFISFIRHLEPAFGKKAALMINNTNEKFQMKIICNIEIPCILDFEMFEIKKISLDPVFDISKKVLKSPYIWHILDRVLIIFGYEARAAQRRFCYMCARKLHQISCWKTLENVR